jgi:uncharacterized protein (TIGR02118 family)
MSEKRDIRETAQLLGRRSALVLGALSATALFGSLTGSARAQDSGGVKLTILIAPPKDPDAFTKYYLGTHMPLVAKTPGVKRIRTCNDLAATIPSACVALLRHHGTLFRELWCVADGTRVTGMESGRGGCAQLRRPKYI